MKNKVGLIGSGNIGWAIEQLLNKEYELKIGDLKDGLDATNESQVQEFLKDRDVAIVAVTRSPNVINRLDQTLQADELLIKLSKS